MLKMVRYRNREQWLKARKRFIGGSDVSCILGLNPYKTNVQLYREKKGIVEPDDISDNPLVIYGTKAEEHIRALFELDRSDLKVEYIKDNSWRNTDYPFAACSLDGWSTDNEGRKGILEIKTATITSGQQSAKWKDAIPDNYYCQVLFYLGVTEWSFVDLRANLKYQFPDSPLRIETRDYHIERSEVEEDIATIMEKAAEFAESLEKNIEPPLILTL
jgi:putative phage-type endonuclease